MSVGEYTTLSDRATLISEDMGMGQPHDCTEPLLRRISCSRVLSSRYYCASHSLYLRGGISWYVCLVAV